MKRYMWITVLFVLTLIFSCIALAEEDNSGTIAFVSELQENEETVSIPEDGLIVEEDYVPETVEKEVIGTDDRILIKNTKDFPYRAVAYMYMERPCGCTMTGTGFLVGKNKLITAAHCLVCHEHGVWSNKITFYFGYMNDRNYAYKYSGRWYAYVGSTFQNGYQNNDDWAVVKLYENVGDSVGWFGWKSGLSDSVFQNKYLNLLGYRHGVLRWSSGPVEVRNSKLIKYTIDTEKGNSGGPLYVIEDGNYYAVAINIAGDSTINIGHRITGDVAKYLRKLDEH